MGASACPRSSPASRAAMSPRLQRAVDIDQEPADGGRLLHRDFLDVHAAFGRKQNERLTRLDVVQHGGIEFARDLGLRFDQQTLDLVVADGQPKDLRRHLLGLRRRVWPV